MSALLDAVDTLYATLATLDELHVVRGTGVPIDTPGVTVGPPKLLRQLPTSDPSMATFQIAVVVAVNERAMDELLRLEPIVAAAVDALPQVAVGESIPGTWRTGAVELPAYLIDVDYAL